MRNYCIPSCGCSVCPYNKHYRPQYEYHYERETMKVFFSEPPKDPQRAAFALERVSELYRLHFIADDSRVWIDITNLDPCVWVLNDRSSLVWTHVSSDPGCVRLTDGKVRWGNTYAASSDAPEELLNLVEFPGDTPYNFTYVVKHFRPEKTVTVIDKSETKTLTNGYYISDNGVAVVDSQHFRPEKFHYNDKEDNVSFRRKEGYTSTYGAVDEFTKSHATINGAEFLTNDMTKKKKLHFRNNNELYSVNIAAHTMDQVVNIQQNAFAQIAEQINNRLEKNLDGEELDDDA